MALLAAASSIPGLLRPASLFEQDIETQPKPTERELAAIAEIANQFMNKYNVPSLSVSIARHGQFVYREGFGFADKAKGEKVTPSHLFRIASVTKPITAVAIFSLIENSRIKLSEFIFGDKGILQFDYGTHYSDLVQKITLEHLLTHTCGGWENDGNDPMIMDPTMDAKDLIRWTLQNEPLKNEPGKHFAYSNFGYCILGRVLEKISGQSYAEFVQQAVMARCDIKGMLIAGNTLHERAPDEVVYYGQNGDDPYRYNIRRMDSHGGWIGTPSDLVQFALRVDGFAYVPNILNKLTIQIMTTPSAVFSNYAKGWFVNEVPNWWHGGSLPGTTTIMVRTASGLCWAAFTNTRTQGMDSAIDRMMWNMVKAVPAWRAWLLSIACATCRQTAPPPSAFMGGSSSANRFLVCDFRAGFSVLARDFRPRKRRAVPVFAGCEKG